MIKVIIERHVASELTEHYERVAKETLGLATQAHGFLSGEVLRNANDHSHYWVIANYRTISDWQHWLSSAERKQMMEQIGPMLETEEKISILEH